MANSPTEPRAGRWPSQIKYIIGNEVCERFSYYGIKSVLAGYITGAAAFRQQYCPQHSPLPFHRLQLRYRQRRLRPHWRQHGHDAIHDGPRCANDDVRLVPTRPIRQRQRPAHG